jgi:outer membrane protein assembly factor BamB
MLKNMDEDKDGAVSEQEWTQRIEAMEKSDVPVLMAVRGGSFTNSEQRVAWKYGRGIPEIPSLLAYEGKLFMIRDGGLLQCLDAASGSLLYQERIGVDGGYAASPVAAQGHVYLASQSGTITVIDARANRLDVLARNPLEEQMTATPALVEGRIYIRTAGHLIAFGRK